MTIAMNKNTEQKLAALEATLSAIENSNDQLSKDLEQAREHEKLRMMVHAEELRRAKAHCDKLDRIIDKTRKQASFATARVKQIEEETSEKTSWFKHQEKKEAEKKGHRPLAILRSIF